MVIPCLTESITRAGGTISTSGIVLVQAPITAHIRYGDRIAATGILAFLVHNAADFTAYQPGVLVPFVALLAALGGPGDPGGAPASI